tara:strand:- start:725 stop:1168 length:444 start_codon:yes stop_codon:yes gene_type:complete
MITITPYLLLMPIEHLALNANVERNNMGYRSTVHVVTRLDNKELIAALVAASPDNTEVGVVNSIILESEIPVMSFEFHDIKWYESYAEVSAVMTEIDTLITEDKDESFGYIEIGEEDNDITQLGCPFYYNLHMERIVTMPTLKVIKE